MLLYIFTNFDFQIQYLKEFAKWNNNQHKFWLITYNSLEIQKCIVHVIILKLAFFFLARSNLLKYIQTNRPKLHSTFFLNGAILFILFSKGAVSISHTLLHVKSKVIYPKYSKHWLSTVAHTIDCVCGKMV